MESKPIAASKPMNEGVVSNSVPKYALVVNSNRPAMLVNGSVSSSRMISTEFDCDPSTAPVALLNTRLMVRSGLMKPLSRIGTVNERLVWPKPKVSIPCRPM